MLLSTNLSAGKLAPKERWMHVHKADSPHLGLGYMQELAGLLRSVGSLPADTASWPTELQV